MRYAMIGATPGVKHPEPRQEVIIGALKGALDVVQMIMPLELGMLDHFGRRASRKQTSDN